MVSHPTTVAELIGLWPSAEVFARDLKLKHTSHGRMMRNRGSIHPRWWNLVVDAAERRGIEGVTHALLADLHPEQLRRLSRLAAHGRRSVDATVTEAA